jgi:hypothetical protein
MTFALFIIEEGLQVLMFSSWASKDLPKETRQQIVDLYYSANIALKALNWAIGVFVPPMFVAYYLYSRAGDVWIKAQIEGFGLRHPIPDLSWLQNAVYSIFAFFSLVLLILVIRKYVVDRAAAYPLNIAQLRESKRKRRGE